MCSRAWVCVCACVRACVCMCVCARAHARTHALTYVYTYLGARTDTCAFACMCVRAYATSTRVTRQPLPQQPSQPHPHHPNNGNTVPPSAPASCPAASRTGPARTARPWTACRRRPPSRFPWATGGCAPRCQAGSPRTSRCGHASGCSGRSTLWWRE